MVTVTGIAPGANGVVEPAAEPLPLHDRTRSGALRVAAVFGDGMVLQRGKPITVFGTAPAGRTVAVTLTDLARAVAPRMAAGMATSGAPDGIPGTTLAGGPGDSMAADGNARGGTAPSPGTVPAVVARGTATAGDDGSWTVLLPALPAGGPYRMDVSCETDRLSFGDVMLGEVWFAGGQSNMELELHTALDGAAAIDAAHDPLLRFVNIPKVGQVDEAAEAASSWQPAVAPQVAHMSAVAYWFGRRLRERLAGDIAVGIIDCYIGGTSITCWMDRATLEASPAARPYLEEYDRAIAGKSLEEMRREKDDWQRVFDRWNADVEETKRTHPGISQPQIDAMLGPCPWPPPVTPFSERRVSAPFEGMVARVAPVTVAGFLWYQGEEDETHAGSYAELLRLLIGSWRDLWGSAGRGDRPARAADPLPFLLVQLPQWIDGRVAAAGADPLYWPRIRAAQREVAQELDGVGIVCTMDCGEFDNIHPLDKRTVGDRLADRALHDVYGQEDAPAHSPQAVAVRADDDGRALRVSFAHADRLHWGAGLPGGAMPDDAKCAGGPGSAGLPPTTGSDSGSEAAAGDVPEPAAGGADGPVAGNIGAPAIGGTDRLADGDSGFEVAGGDGTWVTAEARIMDDGTVLVHSGAVASPRRVRYAWRSWGPAPLRNGDELPAFPFDAGIEE